MFLYEPLSGEAGILEEVPERATLEAVPPPLPTMFDRVVKHVTALAKCGEVCRRIVARVLIEMRAGEDDVGRAHRAYINTPNCNPLAPVRIANSEGRHPTSGHLAGVPHVSGGGLRIARIVSLHARTGPCPTAVANLSDRASGFRDGSALRSYVQRALQQKWNRRPLLRIRFPTVYPVMSPSPSNRIRRPSKTRLQSLAPLVRSHVPKPFRCSSRRCKPS